MITQYKSFHHIFLSRQKHVLGNSGPSAPVGGGSSTIQDGSEFRPNNGGVWETHSGGVDG